MSTIIRISLPTEAAEKIKADPEAFKLFMEEAGFPITRIAEVESKSENAISEEE